MFEVRCWSRNPWHRGLFTNVHIIDAVGTVCFKRVQRVSNIICCHDHPLSRRLLTELHYTRRRLRDFVCFKLITVTLPSLSRTRFLYDLLDGSSSPWILLLCDGPQGYLVCISPDHSSESLWGVFFLTTHWLFKAQKQVVSPIVGNSDLTSEKLNLSVIRPTQAL